MRESPKLIDIHRLLWPEPVAAGMDPYVLMALAKFYRCANEHADEPIHVRMEGENFRIVDGRHRATASMMAGRKQVLAQVLAG